VYFESFTDDVNQQNIEVQQALAGPMSIAEELAQIKSHTGMDKPTVIT
jgi:phosphoglucomutase